MANKVKFGLSNCVMAPIKSDGTYDTPIAVPGAVNLSLEPQGDTNDFYADTIFIIVLLQIKVILVI